MSQNEIETVKVVGVRRDGTQQVIGEATMSPKMKARDIVREMFGAIDEEASNDAAMAFWCCEQLIDWMAKQDAGVKKLQMVSLAPAEVVGWQYKGPATGQQWWHADRPMYDWAKQQPDYETRELCVAAGSGKSA